MNIWYDVSDLMDWKPVHLTGIQRVVVGVLNGMAALDSHPRLVAFEDSIGFTPVDAAALPSSIRRHLRWTSTEFASSPSGSIRQPDPRGCKEGGRYAGRSEEWQDFYRALREFDAAGRRLRKCASRWVRERLIRDALRRGRFNEPHPQPPGSVGGADQSDSDAPSRHSLRCPFAEGDTFVSLGATWNFKSHADSAGGLRDHGVRVVRMIHDLIPTLKPEWVDDPARGVRVSRSFTSWARKVLAHSDHVLANSEFTKGEILRYCATAGIAIRAVSAIRAGDVFDASPQQVTTPRVVPARPFFLFVSTLDPRKNHRLLYDAWCILADRIRGRCPDLVWVGASHPFTEDLLREVKLNGDVSSRIHCVQDCGDEELAWYYTNCSATIYPSRYEGWGIPVAESLAYGRLTIASRAASIPEISADLPEFFDPFDLYGLVALVERVIHDPEWVRKREEVIKARFVPTPWSHTAEQVLRVLQSAVTQHGTPKELVAAKAVGIQSRKETC